MWVNDNEKMNDLVKNLNSPYAACLYSAKIAKQLQKDANNVISESDALTWAISGIPPSNLEKKLKIKFSKENIRESDRIDTVLANIDEDYIRSAVLKSYRASIRSKRLVYEYNGITDKYIKTRIRILTKMAFIY